MDHSQAFWLEDDRWPKDNLGFTFLARAVHQVGKALFPEWSGNEPRARLTRPLWPWWAADLENRQAADAELLAFDDDYESRPIYAPASQNGLRSLSSLGALPTLIDFNMTEEQYQRAAEHIAKRNTRLAPEVERFEAAQAFVAEHAVTGDLRCCTRARKGGDFIPLATSCWNTEPARYAKWFAFCGVHPDQPFDGGPRDFIFVEQAGLSRVLEARTSSDGATQNEPGAREAKKRGAPVVWSPEKLSSLVDAVHAQQQKAGESVVSACNRLAKTPEWSPSDGSTPTRWGGTLKARYYAGLKLVTGDMSGK